MMGDYHVRFCERLGMKFPLSTRFQTDFRLKSKPLKHSREQKKLKAIIAKECASRLEGRKRKRTLSLKKDKG